MTGRYFEKQRENDNSGNSLELINLKAMVQASLYVEHFA